MLRQLSKEETDLQILTSLDDFVAFYIFHTIIQGEQVLSFGDGLGRFQALQNPGHQICVWADRSLPQRETMHMFAELLELTENQDNMKMLCSLANYPLVEELVRSRYKTRIVKQLTLLPYHCPRMVELNCAPGRMLKAGEEHIEIIAGFLVNFMLDCLNEKTTLENQLERASGLIAKNNLYLWQDGNEVVSMANVAFRSAGYARINCVFTRRDLRGRGYGQMLMASVNSNLLKEGIVPMLYADANYPASNAAYRKSGYLPVYLLQELELKRR